MSNHIFISYTRNDEDYAEMLRADLEKKGFKIWIDHKDLIPGTDDYDAAIRKGIEGSKAFILVATPRVLRSKYVKGEVKIAQHKNVKIVPVLFEGDWIEFAPVDMTLTQHIDVRGDKYKNGGLGEIVKALGGTGQQDDRSVPTVIAQPPVPPRPPYEPARSWIPPLSPVLVSQPTREQSSKVVPPWLLLILVGMVLMIGIAALVLIVMDGMKPTTTPVSPALASLPNITAVPAIPASSAEPPALAALPTSIEPSSAPSVPTPTSASEPCDLPQDRVWESMVYSLPELRSETRGGLRGLLGGADAVVQARFVDSQGQAWLNIRSRGRTFEAWWITEGDVAQDLIGNCAQLPPGARVSADNPILYSDPYRQRIGYISFPVFGRVNCDGTDYYLVEYTVYDDELKRHFDKKGLIAPDNVTLSYGFDPANIPYAVEDYSALCP